MPAGRPTKATHENKRAVVALLKVGKTMAEIADDLDIARSTIYEWAKHDPEFSDSIKEGHEHMADKLEMSLYSRAMGCSVPETRVLANGDTVEITKYYPPDTTALIFALRNKRPDVWRDKAEVEHSGKVDLEQVPTEALEARLQQLEQDGQES